MALETFKTFDNAMEAHLLKSKFESEGIECYLFDEHTVSLNPLYNLTVGGIKLKINDFDFEKALQITQSIENTLPTNEEGQTVTCPNCGSKDLYTGFKSMKGIRGFLSAVLSIALTIFPIYLNTVYKCKNCNLEFKA